MRLFPVPFAPGMDQGTDPAFMGAGQLTLAENVRPARNGRLAKRPHVSLVHSGGSTYRPVQFVDSVGSTNLVAAESELFVSDGTALHSAGTLPCGTPLGMRDYQHTGETAEDTPEVRVLAVSSVPMGDEVVVAYEYQTGGGFGLRTRTMTRVFHRGSGRLRAQSTSLAVSEEQPMLMEVPGQGVRLFYRHRAGEVPGNGVFSAPIQTSGSAARGSALAGVVDITEFVDTYSVATHPSLTSYYFIATCSSSGLGLRLWRVNAANNAPLDSVLVTAGTTSVAAVDICVSPTRVWVVWKDGNAVRARVYSHDFTTFVSPNNQINTVDETAPFQPFVSYRESDGMAVALWSSTNTTVPRAGSQCCSFVLLADDGASFPQSRNLQFLRPLSRVAFLTHQQNASTTTTRMIFAGAEPPTTAPNSPRLFELVFVDGRWKALAVANLEGQANPLELPGDVHVTDGHQVHWAQRVFLRDNMWACRGWEVDLSPAPQRRPVRVGNTLLIPGGELVAFSGAATNEAGFTATPRILQAASSGQGSPNIPAGVYEYTAVYEAMDTAGRLRRSPPALPVVFTAGGTTSTDLSFPPAPWNRHRGAFVMHIYRTLCNGTVAHKLTTLGVTGITYEDGVSDATLAERPILYTEGGVLPYDAAPASTFGVRALGRVWLGGLFERCRVVCSTDIVPGEMPGFPIDPTHWLEFPEDVTGLAEFADELVVFSRHGIWVVSGDGPSITGVGEFPAPRRIPTDLGCVNWRSIVSTGVGVFYQSEAGIMLLSQGATTYIGRAIADELTARPHVLSAALHGEGDSAVVRFVLADRATNPTSTRVATFSLRAGAWSVESHQVTVTHLGDWRAQDGGTMPVLAAGHLQDGILIENGGTETQYVESRIRTGEIAPFGFGGEFRVSRVWVRLLFRGRCRVRLSVLYDEQDTATDYVEWELTGLTDGAVVRREWRPRRHQCSSVRFELRDEEWSGELTNGRGVDFLGLVLEVEPVGAQQLATAQRS